MSGILGEEIDARRLHVKPLLTWACEGGARNETHPHYTAVTEGRDPADERYSSCGDLAHWELFRLGCRQNWINRREHAGWRSGMNVGELSSGAPTRVRRTPMPGAAFDTGDILIVWNKPNGTDAHVMVVYEFSFSPLRLIVAEYGQPGGHIVERKLTARDGELYIGSRQVQRWMPLHLVLKDAAERDLLAPVSLPWETP